MFDELKTLIRDLIKSALARFEPLEADVKEVKADLADLKAFRDELKSSGFGDLKSDLDALGGKGAAPKPADPAAEIEAETKLEASTPDVEAPAAIPASAVEPVIA